MMSTDWVKAMPNITIKMSDALNYIVLDILTLKSICKDATGRPLSIVIVH